jgi:2-iminobutanoate/2-iminopropanoate deaminase
LTLFRKIRSDLPVGPSRRWLHKIALALEANQHVSRLRARDLRRTTLSVQGMNSEPMKRSRQMKSRVETLTPPNTPKPIGPYSHIAKVGEHISIGGTAGVDPATGQLAGTDIGAQTRQILKSFVVMLEAVGSDLSHVTHINIFLQHMSDFEAMNAAYVEVMGDRRPARTVISVRELPKPGALLTMNLTAVTREP